jgi:hypothetical protein
MFFTINSESTFIRNIEPFDERSHRTFPASTLPYHSDLRSFFEFHVDILERVFFINRTIGEVPVLEANGFPRIGFEDIRVSGKFPVLVQDGINRLKLGIHLHDSFIAPSEIIERTGKFFQILIEDYEISRENHTRILKRKIPVTEYDTEGNGCNNHLGREPLEFGEYEVLLFDRKYGEYFGYQFLFCHRFKVECNDSSDIGNIVVKQRCDLMFSIKNVRILRNEFSIKK